MIAATPAERQYTFARFHPEHLATMAKLRFEEYGGAVAEHQKWLEWLMCRNPAGTGEASLAFLPDGSLVGMALNAALPIAFKNERFNGRMNISALVKRDQRGGHLFIRQLRMVCDDSLSGRARVVIGFPNANAMLGTLIVGQKVAGAVYSANCPLFLLSWISNKIALPRPLRSSILDGLLSKAFLKRTTTPRYTRLESLENVRFEPEIDPDRLTIYADVDWLDWRYLQSPFQYAILAVGDPKRPDALAIARTASNKSADGRDVLYGFLMDVIKCTGASSDAEIDAGRAGVSWLREQRCHSVKSAFVRGTPYEALLSKVGFWTKRSPEFQPTIFMRAAPDHRIPRRIDRYAITYSWADWI
jgi:hypothetical protein